MTAGTAPAGLAKGCPFCGAAPSSKWYSAEDGGYWGIDCCHAFAHEGSEAEAIAAWNTRPAAPTESRALPENLSMDAGHKLALLERVDGMLHAIAEAVYLHIAWKAGREEALRVVRLAADAPPEAVVADVSQAFNTHGDQIMSNEPMTLIERLRNPAFVTNPDGGDALLDVKQARTTMDDAADTLGALMAIIKMANLDRSAS